MIEIHDLSFRYHKDGPLILDGIDLQIPAGQWLAVIGANGSGKSTLARCLNGLLQPLSGWVAVDGLRTDREEELFPAREKVAFVFQNPDNQLVAATVEDDIAFGPENLGLPPDEISRRVETALSVTHLQALRQKAPSQLSGGEKQRVAIAGALAMAAEYLVLDEPTSMLDPLMRAQVLENLQELHRQQGLGMIYVTNIMEEVLLADQVILLGQGKIVASGTPREIFSQPELLTAQHLDMPQISRLAGMLAEAGHPQLRGALNVDEMVELLCK